MASTIDHVVPHSMVESLFRTDEDPWMTSSTYACSVDFPVEQFHSVANLLLSSPNLLSTHLFRADILHDTASELDTPDQKEARCGNASHSEHHELASTLAEEEVVSSRRYTLPGWTTERTVVRRLIPRKPQLDHPLMQSCHFLTRLNIESGRTTHLLVFMPHVLCPDKLPFYHPPVRGLAYLFQAYAERLENASSRSLSVHLLPFLGQDVCLLPLRYHRMFDYNLSTFCRLAHSSPNRFHQAHLRKDTVIPQHRLQNTYTRLKERHASGLIERWVEKTDPAKHVFEDLMIAAFLIELWRDMYRMPVLNPTPSDQQVSFPGFVDLACGNGVLVYVLLKEGYTGWGFDARRRKSWSTFPIDVQSSLHETICVPRPFLARYSDSSIAVLDGVFPKGTFMISNHADELTPWTPLLAVLSDPECPLPFLIIPCCSHALDGTRTRYKPRRTGQPAREDSANEQPMSGDLQAMRKAKQRQSSGDPSTSTYASLTAYVADLASEIGYEIEQTLMRIPSTRNIGLIGRRQRANRVENRDDLADRIQGIIERECHSKGGVLPAARTWTARLTKLQLGER